MKPEDIKWKLVEEKKNYNVFSTPIMAEEDAKVLSEQLKELEVRHSTNKIADGKYIANIQTSTNLLRSKISNVQIDENLGNIATITFRDVPWTEFDPSTSVERRTIVSPECSEKTASIIKKSLEDEGIKTGDLMKMRDNLYSVPIKGLHSFKAKFKDEVVINPHLGNMAPDLGRDVPTGRGR